MVTSTRARNPQPEPEALAAAQRGERRAFDELVEGYRAALHAHCYRLLGSASDADDALQEALLGAWQGIGGFAGKSSLRSWLYAIATHAALRVAEKRPRRVVPLEQFSPADPRAEVGPSQTEIPWLEPYPEPRYLLTGAALAPTPEARYSETESIELAFVAALQHLPPNQRAVLLLREVLGFSAEETAHWLATSVASVNSAVQRARKTLAERLPPVSQEQLRRERGDRAFRELVERFVSAWQRADIEGIVSMLAEDAIFTMPPLAAWFRGRDAIRTFFEAQVFARSWVFVPAHANGQPGLACYMWDEASQSFPLSVINVFTFRGDRVCGIAAFLDPRWLASSGLPARAP